MSRKLRWSLRQGWSILSGHAMVTCWTAPQEAEQGKTQEPSGSAQTGLADRAEAGDEGEVGIIMAFRI